MALPAKEQFSSDDPGRCGEFVIQDVECQNFRLVVVTHDDGFAIEIGDVDVTPSGNR